MRSNNRWFRFAIAVLAVGGVALAGAPAASATAARPLVAPAAGTYAASFPEVGATSPLIITNGATTTAAGTFEFTDFGDYGTWVVQGQIIALQVAASSDGHEGIVLIGKVSRTGISGQVAVAGFGEGAWTATRAADPSAAPTAGPRPLITRHTRSQARPDKGAVDYLAQFPDVSLTDTLTMTKDLPTSRREGTFTFVTLQDTGNWVQMGKHVALGISTGEDAGVVMLGNFDATGIDSAASPGLYDQPSSGVFPWYADKVS